MKRRECGFETASSYSKASLPIRHRILLSEQWNGHRVWVGDWDDVSLSDWSATFDFSLRFI